MEGKERKENKIHKFRIFCNRHRYVVQGCVFMFIVLVSIVVAVLMRLRWIDSSNWVIFDFAVSLIGLFSLFPAVLAWLTSARIEENMKNDMKIFGPETADEKAVALIITCTGGNSIAQQVENYLINQCKNLPDDDRKKAYSHLCGKNADVLDSIMEYEDLGRKALETLEESEETLSFQVKVKFYRDREDDKEYPQPIIEILGPSTMPANPNNLDLTAKYISYYRYVMKNVLKKLQKDGVIAVHLFVYAPAVLGTIAGSILDNNMKTYIYHRNYDGIYCPIGLLQ